MKTMWAKQRLTKNTEAEKSMFVTVFSIYIFFCLGGQEIEKRENKWKGCISTYEFLFRAIFTRIHFFYSFLEKFGNV